jgi:hypothetical protein
MQNFLQQIRERTRCEPHCRLSRAQFLPTIAPRLSHAVEESLEWLSSRAGWSIVSPLAFPELAPQEIRLSQHGLPRELGFARRHHPACSH